MRHTLSAAYVITGRIAVLYIISFVVLFKILSYNNFWYFQYALFRALTPSLISVPRILFRFCWSKPSSRRSNASSKIRLSLAISAKTWAYRIICVELCVIILSSRDWTPSKTMLKRVVYKLFPCLTPALSWCFLYPPLVLWFLLLNTASSSNQLCWYLHFFHFIN